ncbi:lipopolysaccharide assembly protein LapA domain-containing protein [Tepidicella xavieri]|uniref:Uncharacterized protein DUF1049 n=1 Tax=Tepidicella xavieri TaxID=360241 RepID=A0A4R6UC89_9BURK|nr:lipopolysaccharide assembly protein LapA domain-containing protein [Tepidicella xavieri]TDQ43506.1 uncharacterized protein DUF1049 [Tepidicella xavieri]
MAKWFKTAVIVLFTAVVLVFTLQNIQSVTVAFLTASITLPVSLLVIGVYVLGMFTGGSLLSLIRHVMADRRQPQD